MGLTKFAINVAVKLKKIEEYNTYLFIGPHPDDIEIGAGATISKLVKLGKEVHFLICTDGRFGRENMMDKTPDEAALIRMEECKKSGDFLGIKQVHFLGLSDGAMYDDFDLKCGIAKVISKVKPDIIFAPDPDVTSESHQDHLNVGRAAKELACFANFEDILQKYGKGEKLESVKIDAIAYFMTAKPNRFVRVSKQDREKQLSSIFDCHTSQYKRGTPASDSLKLYLNLRSIEYGLFKFGRYEGFRMLNQTRMHCLPEAGN